MHTPSLHTLPPPTPRALIADDQPDVLTALRFLLRTAGYQTEAVTSPAEVLEAIKQSDFDLVFMDLNYARDTTSGQEGLDLITNIQTLDSALPIVVLTAWGSVELAMEAMHRGGRDFVQKPWDNSRLLESLNTQIELGRKKRQQRRIDAENRTERDKLHQELEESQEIQAALMPKALPDIDTDPTTDSGPKTPRRRFTRSDHGSGKRIQRRRSLRRCDADGCKSRINIKEDCDGLIATAPLCTKSELDPVRAAESIQNRER